MLRVMHEGVIERHEAGCFRRAVWLSLAAFCLLREATTSAAWFEVPPGAGISNVLDSADNQFSWYAGPADQQEWLINNGSRTTSRIKGWQDVTGLKFDLAAFRGRRVAAAELHLCRANTDRVTSLVAATINTDWPEGSACWRFRALPGTEWTFDHSEFSAASFGNYGSLVCFGFPSANTFRSYTNGGNTWIAMILDPAVVQALILDQYGLMVTDPRLHLQISGNPAVYTRNQNSSVQPRLFIQFAPNTNSAPPEPVGALAAEAGAEDGSVVLRFTAPSDPDDGRAFGYNVRYATNDVFDTATVVERWRIPRPRAPGAVQRVLLEGLAPGTSYRFFVQAYDAAGTAVAPASVRFTLPGPAFVPTLGNGGLAPPDATGRTVRNAGGVMRYFGASEVAQINPVTGNRIEDGYNGTGADDYKKANVVWDAASNMLSLAGCRNEIVGAQLILQRLGASLNGIGVSVSDLLSTGGVSIASNPNIEVFQMHYVNSGTNAYAEAAIPLAAPFPTSFNLPDVNHNAGGTYQSVYLDLFIPPTTSAGVYTGVVSVSSATLGADNPARIGLRLRVSDVMIPDNISFVVDLNGYGNPWDFGPDYTATCRRYFQTLHKHRATLNTLPYGWSGSVYSDRAPTLTGNGPTRQASSWAMFDAKYGGLFSTNLVNSIFNSAHGYTGPGVNTPVTHFYTPFHEIWPQSMLEATYGFDAAGRGPAYWDNLRATGDYVTLFSACPDVRTAFPDGYRQAQINVMSNWLTHASANGWTRTAFETYLNNKFYYSGTHSLWALEENETADDFRATGRFQEMWRDGLAASGVTDVRWHFRIDISDRWGQHYGQLDERVNWFCTGNGAAGWHWPSKKYRAYGLDADRQEDWIWYGLGAPVAAAGTVNAQVFLQKWCQGFNGGLPYWDSYNTQWVNADDATPCVVYSGQNVPGFGTYSGPIVSRRVKAMRQAQQIIELLNLWSANRGMNRSRTRAALNAAYGLGRWDYAFGTLDEVKLYQLRAALVAQLESQPPALRISEVSRASDQSVVLRWPSVSNCVYTILRTGDLGAGTFQPTASGLPASAPINVYTDTVGALPAAFYRLNEQSR